MSMEGIAGDAFTAREAIYQEFKIARHHQRLGSGDDLSSGFASKQDRDRYRAAMNNRAAFVMLGAPTHKQNDLLV